MDFFEICRICLQSSKERIPLESPLCLEDDNIKTVQEVVVSLGVNFDIDDNLPQNLCTSCTDRLRETSQFIHLIKKSDQDLKEELLARSLEEHSKSFYVPDTESKPTAKLNQNLEEPVAIIRKDGSIEYKTAIKQHENQPPKGKNTTQLVACSICGKALAKLSLSQHMKTIHGREPFRCTHCPKGFKNRRNLVKHLQIHKNRERTFQCGTCQKTFFSKSHLIIHNESHLNVTYSCDTCGKSFYRQEGLKYHLKKHLGETVKCELCSKMFSTASDLRVHMRFHNKEFPFKCDLCPEKFVIKGNFNYHMKQHKSEKFKCSICFVEISLASAFRRHVFSHTGRPFPCPAESCESSFTARSLLCAHMKSRHDRDLSMEELKFINTNFQVKLRSLSLPLKFDMNEEDKW